MKEITENQYALIQPYLLVQRGNVRVSNLNVINAIRRKWLQMAGFTAAFWQMAHGLHADASVGRSGRFGSVV